MGKRKDLVDCIRDTSCTDGSDILPPEDIEHASTLIAIPPSHEMRRFALIRTEDISGMSGVGNVAEGVEFSDGTVVLRWRTHYSSTVIYSNIKELDHIHSHEGRTKVVWIDDKTI